MIDCHRLIIGLVLLASIGNNKSVWVAAQVNSTKHQTFADTLTAALYTNENECTSALGVSMAFSLVWPGCTGDAIQQVRSTLGYPESTNMRLVWEETLQAMIGRSSGRCVRRYDGVCESETPLLRIANSVWLDDDDALNPEYELVVGENAMQTDFEVAESADIVNDWVEDSTNGLIKSIVPAGVPLYPPYLFVAINSIYLKARWEKQFSKSATRLDSFYSSILRSTEVSKAYFMNQVGFFRYSRRALPDYQVILLPFAESRMSMIFALPDQDDQGPVPLSSTELLGVVNDLRLTRVALSLPKFKFESTYEDNLKRAIIQAGIVAPFSPGSLCGILEGDDECERSVMISKIIQKTVIDCNEEGIEAAAVTAIMAVGSAGPGPRNEPERMILDHPFHFFVYDEEEKLMLFEGRLGRP